MSIEAEACRSQSTEEHVSQQDEADLRGGIKTRDAQNTANAHNALF